jgi:peptide-N4-(N-acetyl-beta-glucosaminyl)asparagine amidase
MSGQQQTPHLRGAATAAAAITTATATTTTSKPLPLSLQHELDIQFLHKIQSTITTVQSWDADPSLLAECRLLIPFEEIGYEDECGSSKYHEERDLLIQSSSARYLQRLVRFFKGNMTWISQPFCPKQCHHHHQESSSSTSTCQSIGIREAETIEEREGQAGRVELYQCTICSTMVTFPRYNSVRKLLQTWSGRCGEYANLFGLVCRAVGYETRYILDVTDHVWTEVYIPDAIHPHTGNCGQWIMVDSCESVIDENSMYEVGWGKELSCIIAIGIDHVVDVTSKYTRKFHQDDFQTRRRQFTTSEYTLQTILDHCNTILRTDIKDKPEQIQKINRRVSYEQKLLNEYKSMVVWEKQYANGRISGSAAWKSSRNEDGSSRSSSNKNNSSDHQKGERKNNNDDSTDIMTSSASSFYTEFFDPVPERSTGSDDDQNKTTISIHVSVNSDTRHGNIIISGVPCAMTLSNSNNNDKDNNNNQYGMSIVVLDEIYLGCILQSKCFTDLKDVANFIATIPSHRIIILNGNVQYYNHENSSDNTKNDTSNQGNDPDIANNPDSMDQQQPPQLDPDSTIAYQLSLLPQFRLDLATSRDGIIYIGQIRTCPDWIICCSRRDISPDDNDDDNKNGVMLVATLHEDEIVHRLKNWKLKTIDNSCPSSIIGRFDDDTIMSLASQLNATEEQKRNAFLSLVNKLKQQQESEGIQRSHPYFTGYTTKSGAPVYLLGNSSYPFHRVMAHPEDLPTQTWNSFLLLPSPLVDNSDTGIVISPEKYTKNIPLFDIPVDENFVIQHIGSNLLMKSSSNKNESTTVHTLDVIRNCRFIGLYFSAHWCGRKYKNNINNRCRKYNHLTRQLLCF